MNAGRTQSDDWYLVRRDYDGSARVVAKNGELQGWRKLGSVYRGATFKAAEKVVGQVLSSGTVGVEGGVFCAPVAGPDGMPHAVLVSTTADPGEIPEVGVWEWRFPLTADAPPVLHVTPAALDQFGVGIESRDRTVYGPADFFTRAMNLSEILPHLGFLYDSDEGEQRAARTMMKGDDGQDRDLHFVEQVGSGPAGERVVRGLCWPAAYDPSALATRTLDIELATALAVAGDQFVAVGDIRFPYAPYVVKWVTSHPPGLGHGSSTGQTPGIHPDDLGRLLEYVMELGNVRPGDPAPTLAGIRARRAGGGWISGSGKGFRLSEQFYPTIWVALITPDHPEL